MWYDMGWYDVGWYDMGWYNMGWYDMRWYDMGWYDVAFSLVTTLSKNTPVILRRKSMQGGSTVKVIYSKWYIFLSLFDQSSFSALYLTWFAGDKIL